MPSTCQAWDSLSNVLYTYIYIYIYICVCVCVCVYTYCDEEIWHPHTFSGLWGKEVWLAGRRLTIVASKNQQTIVVSWMVEKEAISHLPSLLLQSDMGRGEPHSLLAMYASAEKQTCDHDWFWERNCQKANTWWIFKLRKLVSCCLFIKGWRHIMSCHLFVEGWRHIRSCLLFVEKKLRTEFVIWKKPKFQSHDAQRMLREKKKTYPLNEPVLRGMVSLVKWIPKEKTCPWGKRQLLILVLPEIRRVSFYQCVMETQ